MKYLPLMLLCLLPAGAACLPVAGDRIQMRHLRTALLQAGDIPDDAVFGAAPLPGVRRHITAAELTRWAVRQGAPAAQATPTCFEWPMRPLSNAEILEAIRPILPPETEIIIVESSRQPVPPGALQFPRANLREPAPGSNLPVLWQGYVEYADKRRFLLWARVSLKLSLQHVVAAQDLRAGSVITPDQLRQETVQIFPSPTARPRTLDQIAGRVPRVPIKAGTVLLEENLQPAPDVEKGEVIELEARLGRTLLRVQARAENKARIGESLLVRNIASGKVVQARLEAKGRAVVIAGGYVPLTGRRAQ
jgi:flagella basal body P-ring formation protein FlgA